MKRVVALSALILLTLATTPVSACGLGDARGNPIVIPGGVADTCFLPDAREAAVECPLSDGRKVVVSWGAGSMIHVSYPDGTVTEDRKVVYRGCGKTPTAQPDALALP